MRAIAGHAEERIFRRERDAIYNLRDEEVREEAFQILHQQWFERIGLHEPLEEVLSYWPILQTETQRCLLVKAHGKKEIGTELFVDENNSDHSEGKIRSVVIQLSPDLLLQTAPLLDFLRHELLHVVDMLDPEFGYDPCLPKSEIGPTYDRLLQERYPLCHFPSYQLLDAQSLYSTVLHEISQEHPHWNPSQKICQQCADLYELRPSESDTIKK